jgi:hypothetical protein
MRRRPLDTAEMFLFLGITYADHKRTVGNQEFSIKVKSIRNAIHGNPDPVGAGTRTHQVGAYFQQEQTDLLNLSLNFLLHRKFLFYLRHRKVNIEK